MAFWFNRPKKAIQVGTGKQHYLEKVFIKNDFLQIISWMLSQAEEGILVIYGYC